MDLKELMGSKSAFGQRGLRWRRLLAAAIAVLVLLATACGADMFESGSTQTDQASIIAEDVALAADDSTSDVLESSGGDDADSPENITVTAAADDRRALGGGAAPVQVDPAALGRDIIYSANMVVAVDDIERAGAEANAVIADLGGLLFGQETISFGSAESTFTFRVRPQDFQAALGGLGSLGELRNQQVSTEDVTGRVVDLESRISTAAASVERLRNLLGEAATVEVVAQLEQQLLERETDLEVLRGQLRSVRDRVDLATIVLTLTEALARPDVSVSTSIYTGHDGGLACPGDGGQASRGDDVTVCFEVYNEGDAPLGSIELTDTALDIATDELIVVFGDPTAELLPGQGVLFAYETDVDRSLRLRTRVTAAPVTVDGEAINARVVQASLDYSLFVEETDDLPTFRDALNGGWNALKTALQLGLLVLGALIPFLWVPLVLLAIRRWWYKPRARRIAAERESQRIAERAMTADSIPPPPTPQAP